MNAPVSLTPRQPFGPEALSNCARALATGNLSSVSGPLTRELEASFARFYGSRHGIAASSGTAAIHCAVAALGLEPGSEVVVGPITDAGSIVPLLYEGLIPTFCDLDEHLAMTPELVERAITPRTRAIMAIHLFGGASDARALRTLADTHDLYLLEDCSQAHATQLNEPGLGTAAGDPGYLGSFGHIGMFSMQQSKHMTSGDGGVCITDDDQFAQSMRLFRDKGWDRSSSGHRAYPSLGLNYRITELQSAVALPQLATLPALVDRRRELAARLDRALADAPGVTVWTPPNQVPASYWCYPFFVEPQMRDALSAGLAERGVPTTPGYIGAPIFDCLTSTRERRTFGDSEYPFTLATPGFDYRDTPLPTTQAALDRVVVFWLHEDLTEEEVDAVGATICELTHDLTGRS